MRDDRLQRLKARLPAEFAAGKPRVGDERRRVALAPGPGRRHALNTAWAATVSPREAKMIEAFESRRQPILDTQTWDAFELPRVVRHHRGIERERLRGNPKVIGADRLSGPLERFTNSPVDAA